MQRVLLIMLGLTVLTGTIGCGSSATKKLTAAEIQAQKEEEEKVRQAESDYIKKQPKAKTAEQSVEEGERRLRR